MEIQENSTKIKSEKIGASYRKLVAQFGTLLPYYTDSTTCLTET